MDENNNKNLSMDTSIQDKMQALFDLMDEKAAAGELIEEEDSPADAKEEPKYEPMTPSEAAAYEYSMMMSQYDAMLAEWNRLEAEEKAAKAAAKAAEEKGE